MTNGKEPSARYPAPPIPDPTILTTEQLEKGLKSLRELIEARLHCTEESSDRLQHDVEGIVPKIDLRVGQLEALHDEKFRSIAVQFAERDTRTEQISKDSKVAVDAALQAAKEAVGEQNKSSALAIVKSEAATTKQIDQISVLIDTKNKASDEKIDDLKDQFRVMEARMGSMSGHARGANDVMGWIFAGIMALTAIAAVAIAILKH
jgi:hypothetical protein